MVESLSGKVYDIIAEKTLENIRDLGEIMLRPEDFAKHTIENRLGRAGCTVAWTRLLYDRRIIMSNLIPKMADTLSFLHDLVKDEKYKDGEDLIRATLLFRIVRPSTHVINFPKEAIPTLELLIREDIK